MVAMISTKMVALAALAVSTTAAPVQQSTNYNTNMPALLQPLATEMGADLARLQEVWKGVEAQLAQNRASGKNDLWFYWINTNASPIPGEPVTAAGRCGEVSAQEGLWTPPDLWQDPLSLLAFAYATCSLYTDPSLYGPGPSAGQLKLGRCAANGYPVDTGYDSQAGAIWSPTALMGPTCVKHCNCNWYGLYKPARDLPICPDVADQPALSKYCSLCGLNSKYTDACRPPNAPTNCNLPGIRYWDKNTTSNTTQA